MRRTAFFDRFFGWDRGERWRGVTRGGSLKMDSVCCNGSFGLLNIYGKKICFLIIIV